MSNIQTQILYIAVILLSTCLAFSSQKTRYYADGTVCNQFSKFRYVISLLVPWFVIAFTNVGSDYVSYSNIINRLTWSNYSSFFDEEPVMNIVFIMLKTIASGNADIVIFLIKSITIVLVFLSFYFLKDDIKIGYSVLAYLLLLYLPSFYLITISLACAVSFLGLSIFVKTNRRIVPIVLVLFAAQLHNSAYIFLPVFLACIYHKLFVGGNLRRLVFSIAYIIVGALAGIIYGYFVNNVSGFHYLNYGTNTFSGSGIMVLIKYVPLFYLTYRIHAENEVENIDGWLYVFVISSCLFNVLSYKFRVLDRMEFYLLPIFSVFIPAYFRTTNYDRPDAARKSIITKRGLFIILYLLFRGYLVFVERTTTVSGVGFYNFYNPFM